MTSSDLNDDLLAEVTLPALTLLAAAIDREFARREPQQQSIHEYAATQLGVAVGDLTICTRQVEPAEADSVGLWLYETQQRTNATYVGWKASLPAATEIVAGAEGDVRAFRNATVVLPPGVLHETPCVLRIIRGQSDDVELIGRRDNGAEIEAAFTAFLRTRRTSGSPYLRGSYQVASSRRGLLLKRWVPTPTSRQVLKLEPTVWSTIDRCVHRVLELAPDLAARGLGTSAGVLLVGPPGTGKTRLGTVVAHEMLGRATVLLPETSVTEHWLTELFELAADLAPCLILMDDLDLIAGERGSSNPHRLREFLNVMDGGLADRSGVVVVASTNDHRKVDKAAQRSSRFDTVIRMEAPGYDGRLAILGRYLAWCEPEPDLAAVARATDGATGADLKELVRSTVLATRDRVTTQALLAQAAEGRWRRGVQAVGDYL